MSRIKVNPPSSCQGGHHGYRTRQVVRWSIPGWLFLFSLFTYQLVSAVLRGVTLAELLQSPVVQNFSSAIAGLLVVTSIPLGFLTYQIYYRYYGIVWPFGIVSRDRGAEVLKQLPVHVLENLQREAGIIVDIADIHSERKYPILPNRVLVVGKEHRTRAGRYHYSTRLERNWELVRFYLTWLCMEDKTQEFKREYTSLSDLYHAIGASRTAILMSFGVYSAYNLITHLDRFTTPQMWFAYGAMAFGTVWMLRVLEYTRRKTQYSSLAILRHSFHWYSRRPNDKYTFQKPE
jgi:hypothetical protein